MLTNRSGKIPPDFIWKTMNLVQRHVNPGHFTTLGYQHRFPTAEHKRWLSMEIMNCRHPQR
jgi:hypothetical protein